jgi:cell division topological specificity factor
MDWMERLLGHKTNSARQAEERLRLVLINDRTDLSPAALEALKNELLEVISRYIEIDPASVRIEMNQEGREQRLLADIPLKNSRRKRAY